MNSDQEQEIKQEIAEENTLMKMLDLKMRALNAYSPQNAGILAYQLSEIMVHSKNLYVRLLPDLVKTDENDEEEVWKQVAGLRMHLLHLKDCIDGFEQNLIELMEDREPLDEDEKDED